MVSSTGGWYENPKAKAVAAAQAEAEARAEADAADQRSSAPLATVSYFPGVEPIEAVAAVEKEAVSDAASVPPALVQSVQSPFVESPFVESPFVEPEAAPTASEKAAARRADRAANVSMNALTRRGMSRWELEQILVSRELEPDEIETELDRLAGVGLIDDAALAETIVRTHHERKGLGRSALVAEMRRRHIDPDQIEESLEQLDGDSELSRAKELAHKRAPQLRSLDQTTAKRRLTAFLMRKGYSSSVIREAVDEALDAGGSTVRFR